tara:strand:- start:326 stop:1111 length:786 start_codon:yes stop_codon:yes gene_type:complete
MTESKTIWLLGGFGNVLFHLFYAFLLRKHGFDVSICPILTENNFIVRIFGWTIHKPIYKRFCDEYKITRPFWSYAALSYTHKRIGINLGIPFIRNNQHFIPPPKEENLFGYFQNEKQIAIHNDVFLEFCDSIFKLLPEFNRYERVVHFRGSDSSIAASHYAYYQRVKSSVQGLPVTIVTDSLKTAKQFFGDKKNITYISSDDPLDDFVALTNAKQMFCGPSTFSWWAMHISKNAEKIYIPQYLKENLGVFRSDLEVNILSN